MKYDTEFQTEHLGAEGYILKVDYEDANESDKEKLFELLKEDRKATVIPPTSNFFLLFCNGCFSSDIFSTLL